MVRPFNVCVDFCITCMIFILFYIRSWIGSAKMPLGVRRCECYPYAELASIILSGINNPEQDKALTEGK